MKRNTVILAGILIIAGAVASVFAVQNLLYSTPTTSPSPEPAATPTQQPTSTATQSPTPSPTSSPETSPTNSPSTQPTASSSPASTPTPTPTITPEQTPTPTVAPTATPTSTPNPTPQPSQTLTYEDAKGRTITITTPLTRIASLNSGITELMCALGAQDRLVGRSAGCLYPPSVLEVPIVGDSSNSPNLELLLEQEPQLLLADTMIASKTELLEKIENAGIPVIIEQPGNFTRLTDFVEYLGIVLGDQENATEVVDFITYYVGLVHTRVADLSDSQKPLVYLEMSMPWRSPPQTSVRSEYLVETGGINLNANASGSTVTPEFVASANPDIIVRMISSDTHDVSDYESIWTEIMSRDQIRTTNAIKNEKVYIYDSTIFTGLRYPIGALSWAKWFHPDLFSDIDVEAVHQELNQKFYGIPIEGVYTYP